KGASPEAKKLGVGIEPRAVFGWPALVEKLIARQAGIDDRRLDLAKVMAVRHGPETRIPGQRELRLVEAGADDFVIAWVRPADSLLEEAVRRARSQMSGIE